MQAQSLSDPSALQVLGDNICGAGNAVLTASSDIDDPDLKFEWFRKNMDNWVSQGIVDGSSGQSQFITPLLITDEVFSVQLVLRGARSELVEVEAIVTKEADIRQRSAIQMCGEVFLETFTNIQGDSIASYQWQVLVTDFISEAFFEDLDTDDSNEAILTTSELGFYRVVITDLLGCKAISSEVEVTDDTVMVIDVLGQGVHCFLPSNPTTYDLTLRNQYGRDFTEYEWRASPDGNIFSFLSDERQVTVTQPSNDFDTTYYELTLTEQNCSITDTIAVYWSIYPTGTIENIDGSIGGSDFFYCEDDLPPPPTLRAISSSPRVKVEWVHALYQDMVSLDALKSQSGSDPLLPDELLSVIGYGDSITLTQWQRGGLILARFTDSVTDCSMLSDNAIFADSAFPFPIINGSLAYRQVNEVCKGSRLLVDSYDRSADAYSWKKLDTVSGTYTEVASSIPLELDSNLEDISGTYRLEVTKNGCSELSTSFVVRELSAVNAEILEDFDEEVSICEPSDHAFLIARSVPGASYQWLYSPDELGGYVLAEGTNDQIFYKATTPGFYRVRVFADCPKTSDPVEVMLGPDDGDFYAEIEGETSICQGSLVTLSSVYQSDEAEYYWFYQPVGSDDFFMLEDEHDSTLSISSALFGTNLSDNIQVDIYVVVAEGLCRSISDPFRVEMAPRPIVEIRNSLTGTTSDVFYCSESELGFNLEMFQLTSPEVGGLSYQWERLDPATLAFEGLEGEEEITFVPSGPGRYRCVVLSGGFCEVSSNALDVITPPDQIAGDVVFCEGTDIALRVNQGYLPDLSIFSFQWYYSEDNQVFNTINGAMQDSLILEAGSPLYRSGYYYYEVSYQDCVKNSDTLTVTRNESSFDATLTGEINQKKGIPFETHIATVQQDGVRSTFQFTWIPNEFVVYEDGNRAILMIPEDHEEDSLAISVQVTSDGGCSLEYALLVLLRDPNELTFPKFITPNGDGLNDLFTIVGLDKLASNDLRIIDGWGNTIYTAQNFYNQEDQSNRLVESIRNEGVYYYLFQEDKEGINKGSFYLKRD